MNTSGGCNPAAPSPLPARLPGTRASRQHEHRHGGTLPAGRHRASSSTPAPPPAAAPPRLTETGKTWGTNEHIGRLVRTTGGTGRAGQEHRLQHRHSPHRQRTQTALGDDPASGTTYEIYEGPPATTAKATSGSTTTFVVSGPCGLRTSGRAIRWKSQRAPTPATPEPLPVNTTTTLTVAAFAGAIDSTSVGSIYWPSTSLTAAGDTPGALEAHDTAAKETTTTDAGSVGITSRPGLA
jgi:hypothetical protein